MEKHLRGLLQDSLKIFFDAFLQNSLNFNFLLKTLDYLIKNFKNLTQFFFIFFKDKIFIFLRPSKKAFPSKFIEFEFLIKHLGFFIKKKNSRTPHSFFIFFKDKDTIFIFLRASQQEKQIFRKKNIEVK